jgi:Nif-specific regulatory protein
LQVVEIRIPPLRDRRAEPGQVSDIEYLAKHFLTRFVFETGRKITGFTPAALRKMQEHNWPGNVRELRNVVERAVALSTGPMLDAQDILLPSLDGSGQMQTVQQKSLYQPISLEAMEKHHILQTLQHTEWNKTHAATILNIERSTLDRKIKAYELRR